MDGWFNAKLVTQVRFYVCNHLFSIRRGKQIGVADEDHGAGAGLVERLHDDEIVLRESGASIDQHDPKIAPRQVCNRFFGTGNATASEPSPGVSTKVTPSARRTDGSLTKMRVTCFLLPGFFCSVANSASSDNGMICGCASANSIPASATGPWLIRVGIAVTGVTPIGSTSVCKM